MTRHAIHVGDADRCAWLLLRGWRLYHHGYEPPSPVVAVGWWLWREADR